MIQPDAGGSILELDKVYLKLKYLSAPFEIFGGFAFGLRETRDICHGV
jgi:hypothetical protein